MSTPLGRSLLGLLPQELEAWLESQGSRPYRARQILAWVHRRSVIDPSAMTDLSASLREALGRQAPPLEARLEGVERSQDGTRKVAVRLGDGAIVETVLIPEGRRLTQCLSTQVGCAFGCVFCRSGARGLGRSLSADEVLAQVYLAAGQREPGEWLSNAVLMGSGEPLANYEEVARAVRLLTDPACADLSTRRVTVSTVGLPRGIARLGRDFGGRVALAVSLHAADDETRALLVPGARGVPVASLAEALRAYPLPQRRRITIEYVLASGVNDGVEHARRLVRLLSGIRVKVNLIPLNAHAHTELRAPSAEAVESFREALVSRGITAIVRRERGGDIEAACGQLAAAATAADAGGRRGRD